jgi:hypothetical protein
MSYESLSLHYRYSDNKLFILNIFIFIFCFGFMDFSDLIPFLLIPYAFLSLRRRVHSKLFFFTAFFLSFFSLYYALQLMIYDLMPLYSIIGRALYPIIFFVVGFNSFKFIGDKKNIILMFIIPYALSGFGILSYLSTVLKYGNIENAIEILEARAVEEFWTGRVISATGLNSYLSLTVALLPTIFINSSAFGLSRINKIFFIAVFIFSAYVSIAMANRTSLLIMAVSVFWCFMFIESFRLNFFMVGRFFVVFVILLFCYLLDLFSIKSFIESSALYNRFTDTESDGDPRWKAWSDGLTGVIENPWGGHSTYIDVGYAHNLWIDVALDGGFFSAILISVVTGITIYCFLELRKFKHRVSENLIFLCLFSSFFVIFMIEPVLQGVFKYFLIYLFFLGALQNFLFAHRGSVT